MHYTLFVLYHQFFDSDTTAYDRGVKKTAQATKSEATAQSDTKKQQLTKTKGITDFVLDSGIVVKLAGLKTIFAVFLRQVLIQVSNHPRRPVSPYPSSPFPVPLPLFLFPSPPRVGCAHPRPRYTRSPLRRGLGFPPGNVFRYQVAVYEF